MIRTALIAALAVALLPLTALGSPKDRREAHAAAEGALVVVTCKLQITDFEGSDRGSPHETVCLLVGDGQQVVCSRARLTGFVSLLQSAGAAAGAPVPVPVPSEIEVRLISATTGTKASLAAQDSERDLAWLKLDKPLPGGKPVAVDKGAKVEIGDPLYAIDRLHRHFDRAAVVQEGFVSGLIERPHRLWVPSHGMGVLGVPFFTSGGRFVGLGVGQVPPLDEEAQQGGPLGMISVVARLPQVAGGFVLPAADLAAATLRAVK